MNSKALNQNYLKVKILREEEKEYLLEIFGDNSRREIVDENGKAEEGTKLNEKEKNKEREMEEELDGKIGEDEERKKERGTMEESSKDEDFVNSHKPENTKEERGEIKEKTMTKEHETEPIEEQRKEADTKKYAGLATPEVSEEETDLSDEPQHEITVHENFEIPAPGLGCKQCFQILDENMERSNGNGCEHDIRVLKDLPSFDDDETAKMFDEMYLSEKDIDTSWKCGSDETSESLRASLRSLSTCQDSLPSSRSTVPNKHNLSLDLECRICHDTEGQDLISPCHCAGTSKWVHESCIIRWIRHTKTKQCEICTCPIAVKRKKKPIEQWTRPSASCGPCNRLDIWYCFVVALCVFIIIGFVVLQNRYDVTEQIETTVIFASIYVLCGMIIMMKVRYFWTWFVQRSSFWGNWKNLNEEWRIVEANEPNVNSPQSPV